MATVSIVEQIDENIGSMFIGLVVSAILLGVSLVQTYYYYTTYPKDPWFLKTLVAIVTVFDTVHCALITHTIYHYCISNFNRPAELERLVWSVVIEALFTGVAGCLVQCFYLQRIWRLSKKNWILTGIILILILADACCGTVWVVFAIQLDTYQKLLEIRPITITINGLSTAADVLIAASLLYMLAKARTGFKRSDTMINKLILFVINTGALTTACAAASLVSLLASPNTLIYASFYFCIGRLYTNSLLATLNARKILTGNVDDVSHILVSIPSTFTNSVHGAKGSSGAKNSNLAIRVETTTIKHQNHLHPSDRRDLDTKQPIESDEFISHGTRLAQTTTTNRLNQRDSFASDPSYV